MKKLLLIITIIIIIIIAFSEYLAITTTNTNEPDLSNNENVVVRIIDGDTIEMGNGIIIRLLCVDTPEEGSEGYEEAKNFLENLILGKEVILKKSFDEVDAYNRSLMFVYLNDKMINKEIITQGYGKLFPYGNNTCEELIN